MSRDSYDNTTKEKNGSEMDVPGKKAEGYQISVPRCPTAGTVVYVEVRFCHGVIFSNTFTTILSILLQDVAPVASRARVDSKDDLTLIQCMLSGFCPCSRFTHN